MTAINVILQRDAAHLYADGAMIDQRDGSFAGVITKVFPIAHCCAAIAVRGPGLSLPMIAELMTGANGYESMKANAVQALRDAQQSVRAMTARPDMFGDVQIFVAGWSVNGPDAYTVLTAPVRDIPPFEIVPIPEYSFTPFEANGPVHSDIWDIFGGRSVDQLDPRVDGLAVMESQRRHKAASPLGTMHIVGGFVQIVTAGAGGLHTEILKRWPDVVGERIAP